MSHKILEVLIPTYRRPHAAIGAIDSVLASDNPNVSAFCHSNGTEPELEIAAALRPQLRYAYFPENRGAVANFRKMLEDSDATYVLFLSDEDRIDPNLLDKFIDYLSQNKHGFVMCSVVESTGASYFSVAALDAETLSFKDLITLFTASPTYLSGYCFRRDLLNDDALNLAFDANAANVYPHLILRNVISKNTSVGVFGPGIIIKGAEASTGGDSHGHVKSNINSKQRVEQQKLNPSIYGEKARIQQFHYLLPKLSTHWKNLTWYRRLVVQIYILGSWLNTTSDAYKHVDTTATKPAGNECKVDYQNPNIQFDTLSITYTYLLNIKKPKLKSVLVHSIWNLSKFAKLTLFIQRFGIRKTFYFIKNKSS